MEDENVSISLVGLDDLIKKITDMKAQKGMLDNVCGVVGILMMRANVEVLRFTESELADLSEKYDGRQIEFETCGDEFIVRLGVTEVAPVIN